jgi:guanine nucleotide-binding protein subunit alpha
MCFGGGRKSNDDEEAAKSREIDKQIRQDEKKMSREVKLLLLGKTLLGLRQLRSSHDTNKSER